MAVSLKHSFTSPKSDGIDSTIVQPSNWNAEHTLTAAAGKILGAPTGSTTVQELPLAFDSTGQSMVIPSGITGDRPGTPSAGMMRYNTTTKKVEVYTNSAWTNLAVNATVATSAPSSPQTGDFWFDTTNTLIKTYNGSAWVAANATPNDGTVTTAKIVDGNVTYAKLASAVQAMFTPAGMLAPFAGSTAPSGWLLCYGQSVSSTTYASLFAVIGYTYGGSSGNFNLPDLRGRAPAGKDDMGGTSANRLTGLTGGVDGDILGGTGGVEAHTLSTTEIPAHNHTKTMSGRHGINGTGYTDAQSSDGDSGNDSQLLTTNNTGGGGAHNNVQPTIILNYIIKT